MGTLQCQFSSSLIASTAPFHLPNQQFSFINHSNNNLKSSQKRFSIKVQAVKVPAGVEVPKVEPRLNAPFLGFTKNAEIWNSRACMIGLIGTFIVELILNKGILQLIGVEIGKGLDIPL